MLTPSAWAGLVLGIVLQLAMVVAGHFVVAVAELFAPLGVLISLLAGLVYALRAGPGKIVDRLVIGAVVGGGCALIGIAVSFLLGDVPALILVIGTASSAVSGAIGGAIGRWLAR
jgi:hypothetical protein